MPGKVRIVFKAISCLVAGIFLFQQVAWAGDLVETVLNRQSDNQAQTFAPSYLQNQQAIQESIISQKQDAENFANSVSAAGIIDSAVPQPEGDNSVTLQGPRGGGGAKTVQPMASASAEDGGASQAGGQSGDADAPILSITAASGDVIHYKNNAIDSIKKTDGTILRNIVVDENDNLIGAEITYSDGTIQTVAGGKVVRVTRPDGTVYNYNSEELIESVVYPDASSAVYSYQEDSEGNILETIMTDDKKESHYDTAGRLTKVVFKDGKTIKYDSGVISEITESDLGRYIFDIKANEDGTFTSALSRYIAPPVAGSSTTYTYNKDDNGALLSLEKRTEYDNAAIDTVLSKAIAKDSWYTASDGSVYTYWGNKYRDYSIDFGSGNKSASIIVSAKNIGKIDSRYPYFKVEVYIDGTSKGIFKISADMLAYHEGSLSLGKIEGTHVVRIKWLNDWSVSGGYDANIQINSIKFDIQRSPEVTVINSPEVFSSPEFSFNAFPCGKIEYDKERIITSATGLDGAELTYSGGLLNGIEDASGIFASYAYDLDVLDNIKGVAVDRDGIKRIYNEYGKLSRVTDQNTGLTFAITDGSVTRIEQADGTVIEEAEFVGGKLVSARIRRPDNVVVTYKDGVLTTVEHSDGTVITYDVSGNIMSYAKSGINYAYSEIEESGSRFTIAQVTAADAANIEDPEAIVCQKYDADKRLVQLKTKDGKVIDYSYNVDPAGKVTSIVTSDGITAVTYDNNYNIIRQEILPTTEDPIPAISEYAYGRIRHVYKGSELIYEYAYEYDDADEEITVIEDVKAGDVKRYKDELLISVTDKNSLVTAYEYNADKKISGSTVSRSGKLINRYIYTYEGDLTVIEDIDGVKRSYDKNNKIVFLEESGRTYEYTYSKDASGSEVTTQKLIRVKNEAGDIISYNGGEIESIVKADGTIYKDFIRVDGDAGGYVIEKDGVKYFVQNSVVVKEVKADGASIEYYQNGWTKSVTAPDGKVTNYKYEMGGLGPAYVTVIRDGIEYRYDNTGRLDRIMYPDGKILNYLYDQASPTAIAGFELVADDIHYVYGTDHKLVKVIDAQGGEYNYSYDGGSVTVENQSFLATDIADGIDGFTMDGLDIELTDAGLALQLDSCPDTASKLLLHMGDASDGSYMQHTVTLNGDAKVCADGGKFGDAVSFDG
ncbi:MAG: hypothetical protein PHX20_04315, partial [Candidatus Omnitrophica bacterium]|nr:hypothetical protein [Candidatus Omnitrophota bacterium]